MKALEVSGILIVLVALAHVWNVLYVQPHDAERRYVTGCMEHAAQSEYVRCHTAYRALAVRR